MAEMGKLGAGMGSQMNTSIVRRRRFQFGGMGNQVTLKTLTGRQEMGGRDTEAGGESKVEMRD
jgi:hypothetical protein